MANAFTNFLGSVVNGIFGDQPNLRDRAHADRLYVRNNYARAPKVGFLYYIVFNINLEAVKNPAWKNKEVGLLVKKSDLPKFSFETETVNQYNRKNIITKSIKYNPINIELHDDNSNITRDLWLNYFQYYIVDSNHGGNGQGITKFPAGVPPAYTDTKYGDVSYRYGYDPNLATLGRTSSSANFFQSIDLYSLHQQRFSQYTLINPKITDWNHDSVDQSDGAKILTNRMTVQYETVLYSQGKIQKDNPSGFATIHYDTSPSPLSISGNGTNTLFGPGGVIAGADSVLQNVEEGNYFAALIQANNVRKNIGALSKEGLKTEGYSILNGVLGNIQAQGNQPGGVSAAIQAGLGQSGNSSLGRLGVNIFSGQNSSVNQQTSAVPSRVTGTGD